MLVFLRRGENRSTRRKTSRSRVENQQTQPTYDVGSGNRTRDTLVEGERERSHCLIRKWFYVKIITVSWFITLLFASFMAGLHLNEPYSAFAYARTSFDVVNLLVLAVSYIIVILIVQRSHKQTYMVALQVERKLSINLSIVTGVSVLTILPWAIYKSLPQHIKAKRDMESNLDIHQMLAVISFANSLVNPFVYAIRMQAFRKALRNLVSRQRQPQQTTGKQKRTHRSQPDTKV